MFGIEKSEPLIGDTTGQTIIGLVSGGNWLEFISLSQIQGDYNFSTSIRRNIFYSTVKFHRSISYRDQLREWAQFVHSDVQF